MCIDGWIDVILHYSDCRGKQHFNFIIHYVLQVDTICIKPTSTFGCLTIGGEVILNHNHTGLIIDIQPNKIFIIFAQSQEHNYFSNVLQSGMAVKMNGNDEQINSIF